MSITRILLCVAGPMFVLAVCLAYKRTYRASIAAQRFFGEPSTYREATAPRLAGALLVTSTLLAGIALALWIAS